MTVAASQEARIHLMSYGPDDFEEFEIDDLLAARGYRGRRPVTWVNVNAARDPEVLRALEADFGIHPLAVEDVKNTRQRPKVETYPGFVFVVTQMLTRRADGELETEQLSILLGADWIITVQERPGDVFEGVRDRIRTGRVRIRSSGADYLMYALLDAIVDAYFPILEALGLSAEELEDEALEGNEQSSVRSALQNLRRELLVIRRVAWPQRDALHQLERGDVQFVTSDTRTFLRDVSDHATRVIDFVETNRELAASLMDLYLTGVAQRTNDVMKVLTIVATIFIPLTFIAGVYGMNFERMPELTHPYGYPVVIALMLTLALGMLAWFRSKGWL